MIAIATFAIAGLAAAADIGAPAPDFTLTATDGTSVHLADLKGKVVVLEWFNPDCPYVKNVHDAGGALTTLPATWTSKGVVWLGINSSAAGKQGNGKERNVKARSDWNLTYPVLLDESGAVGKAYGAKTTPHIFVIDPVGNLQYAGALDNAPLGKVDGGGPVVSHTDLAIGAVVGGKAVPTASTAAYGCSVKY